ncbi:hypothetical protein BKA64DRAFT_586525 [Cadophora sp. MPI-SDFR-AT-0126]|nr:hypothetical protein BKA64DRAFT_586525 [Leotiomycetes sp. MPI-SDFR-AT-0126]
MNDCDQTRSAGIQAVQRIVPTSRQSRLLTYLPHYRVLICKECQYAIQPLAVSRHLKELHGICRSDREGFMAYTRSLNLANPKDVPLPKYDATPVPFLPTQRGFACGLSGCDHLSVTVKRMKRHWAHTHNGVIINEARWRRVVLQTFFRGNQLRYFAVRGLASPSPMQPPAVNKAPPGNFSSWTLEDLDLLQHFRASTCLEVGHSSGSRRLWQTTIPEMACSYPFLKYGILALSALHLAHLRLPERKNYRLKAASYQNKALPLFSSSIAKVDEETCHPLVAFSKLLLIYCYASEDQDEELVLARRGNRSGLLDWLYIIRGSRNIFNDTWQYMLNGPLSLILQETIFPEYLAPAPENTEHSRRLRLLSAIPFAGNGSKAAPQTQTSMSTEPSQSPISAAFETLSSAFSKVQTAQSHSVYTVCIAVRIWPAQVSSDYLTLLKNDDPAALVLLAHYCVLLKPFDSSWYMQGFRRRLLLRIYDQLDPEWRHWVLWLMEGI